MAQPLEPAWQHPRPIACVLQNRREALSRRTTSFCDLPTPTLYLTDYPSFDHQTSKQPH